MIAHPASHFRPRRSEKGPECWRSFLQKHLEMEAPAVGSRQRQLRAPVDASSRRAAGRRRSAAQQRIEQSVMSSKHHSAATQAGGCQHLDSSEDVRRRKTAATANGGFNWPSGQKGSCGAKVDSSAVIKWESTDGLEFLHFDSHCN